MFFELDEKDGISIYINPEQVARITASPLAGQAMAYDFYTSTGMDLGRITVQHEEYEKLEYVGSILNYGKKP